MNKTSPTTDAGYDPWLDSTEDVDELWQTTDGNTIAVTRKSLYLPDAISPEIGKKPLLKDCKDVDIRVVHHNNTKRVAVPFVFAGVFLLSGFLIGNGIGMVLGVAGLLALLTGSVSVIKDRNNVSTYTYLTIHIGPFSEEYELPGDCEEEFVKYIQQRINTSNSSRDCREKPADS